MNERWFSLRSTVLILFTCLAVGCSEKKQPKSAPSESVRSAKTQSDDGTDYGPDQTKYDRQFSIIIGIDEYSQEKNGIDKLEYAVNDATGVRDILRDEFGFLEKHCQFLTNADATHEAICNAIANLSPAHPPTERDSLLFFFSGHGLMDKKTNEGFLVASDSRNDEAWQRCLSVSHLVKLLDTIPCKHKLVVLDSCYSGTLFRDFLLPQVLDRIDDENGTNSVKGVAGRSRDPLLDSFRAPFFGGISAGGLQPVADGSGKDRHSIFTSAMIRELTDRADSGRADHAFSFRQLAARIETRVRDFPGSQQKPNFGLLIPSNGDFVFRPILRRQTPQELSKDRLRIARHNRYAVDMKAASEAWRNSDIKRVVELLDAQIPQPTQEDSRGFEWYFLSRLCHGERKTFDGHAGSVNSISISPDGKTLASAHENGTVLLWNVSNGEISRTISGHKGSVSAVAFSPDSKLLASAGEDGPVILWDHTTGVEVKRLVGHRGFVSSVAFSPDATELVTAAGIGDGTVIIWNLADMKNRLSLGGHELLRRNQAEFSPDGLTLVRITKDSNGPSCAAYDVTSGREVRVFADAEANVHSVALSPDGKTVACAVGAGDVVFQNAKGTLRTTAQLSLCHDEFITCLKFSPDGKLLATASEDKTVKLWNVAMKRELVKLRGHEGAVNCIAFSPDGKLLASAGTDGLIKVWDVKNPPTEYSKISCRGEIEPRNSLTFSSDGKFLAVANGNKTMLWNMENNQQHFTLADQRGEFRSAAFSVDCKLLAAVPNENTGRSLESNIPMNTVNIWDIQTRRLQTKFQPHEEFVASVAFSPDGVTLGTIGTSQMEGVPNFNVKLLDAVTGHELNATTIHANFSGFIAFTPDGRTLIAGGEHLRLGGKPSSNVSLLDVPSLQRRFTIEIGRRSKVMFTPDGTTLLTADKFGELQLWEVATGQQKAKIAGGGYPELAVSCDSMFAAAPTKDCAVTIWDMNTGKEHVVLRGHMDDVTSVVFSPDNKRVATSSADKYVRLWDIVTGLEVLALSMPESHSGIFGELAFSPDGTKLVFAEGLGSDVLVWSSSLSER